LVRVLAERLFNAVPPSGLRDDFRKGRTQNVALRKQAQYSIRAIDRSLLSSSARRVTSGRF